MNIREASFWKDIEPIFVNRDNEGQEFPFEDAGAKYCDYRALMDRCEHGLRRAARMARGVMLMMVRFRVLGDGVGETDARLLDLACQRVCSCLRSCDSACQLGDGRIAILMEDVTEPGLAELVIGKFHAAITPSLRIGDHEAELALCVGVALHPVDTGNALQLWQLASMRAEQAYRNGTDAGLPRVVAGHTTMGHYNAIRELHHAYRRGKFSLVYQPVFGTDGRSLLGMEALLRWNHDQRGLLEPGAFMDLLEDSGLIVPVGERVLHEACQFVARMQKETGLEGLRVCVNVSGRQLEDGGFMLSVLDAIYDADIAAESLQLELSEKTLSLHTRTLARLVPELRNAGVSLAIDHFGVSGLSLADLVRFPVSVIKMDRSLIEGVAVDAVSQAIVSGALAFARGAGIRVAAVGVEHDTQFGALVNLGCREVQGAWLAPPAAPDGFLDALPG